MVLKELMKFASLGLKAAGMKKSDVKKQIAPLVKAGKLTKREAESFANDLIGVSRKHQDRVRKAIEKELEAKLKKHGYVKVKKPATKKKSTKKKAVKKKATKRKVVKKKVAKKKKATRKKATKKKSRK